MFLAASALLVSIVQAKPHFPLSYSAFSSPSEFAAFNSYYPNYFYDSYPVKCSTQFLAQYEYSANVTYCFRTNCYTSLINEAYILYI